LVISLFSFNSKFKNFSSLEPSLEAEILDKSQYLMAEANLALPSFNLNVIQGNGLEAIAPPFNISGKVLGSWGMEQEKEIREYIIEPGDTLSSVAASFEISLNTLLWANDLNEKSILKPGQKLVILPVSGIIHHVRSGDTVSGIAEIYKGKTEEIVAFNYLSNEDDIYIEDIIIVPNGVMPPPPIKLQQAPASVPLADSYFIAPVPSPYIITQGLHWYNAIDFSYKENACGKPVFAAAGGTIQKIGYQSVAGNYVRILHPNGVITFYGHLSSISVFQSQPVSQGKIIGYIGNTGYTIGRTGCHLHFEVRGARNPFAE
jgi:murein DD-endopeptidase MepM/ murein hydrolase activator NlpD